MNKADILTLYALRLKLTPTLGLSDAWKIIHAFGSLEAVFDPSAKPIQEDALNLLHAKRQWVLEAPTANPAKALMTKIQSGDIRLIAPFTDEYPPDLYNLHDAPLALYVKGNLNISQTKRNLGIVGTRRSTAGGIIIAKEFAQCTAEHGICIVSGLARGIDRASHQGALGVGGQTIAVLGSGFNHIYPRENKRLSNEIIQQGALVSEYEPDTEALPGYFPQRNRIISALSNSLLVVQAPKKSGALITAELAMEQGKDVYIVPGDIKSKAYAGSNRLIQQGAHCALNAEDILWGMGIEIEISKLKSNSALAANEPILQLLQAASPRSTDELIQSTGMEPRDLLPKLSDFEKKGWVQSLAGSQWMIRSNREN